MSEKCSIGTKRKKSLRSYSDVEKCNFVKEYKDGHFKSFSQFVAYKENIFSRAAFSNWMKAWNDGNLKYETCTGRKKQKKGSFPEVEAMLVEYITFHQENYNSDKCGLSWFYLKQKAKDYAKIVYADDEKTLNSFQASSGWLHNVLKSRNKFVHVNLHGEANEISEADASEKECFEALPISPSTATVDDDDDQADTNVDSSTTSTVSLNQFNDAMSVVYDFIVQRSSHENAAALHYLWIKTVSELTKSYLEERAKSSSQPTIQQFFSVQKSNSTL